MRRLRWLVAGFAFALSAVGSGAQTPVPVPVPVPATAVDSFDDILAGDARMTVPISISGRGPYRFYVDTGAERTVVSREVAAELQLAAGRDVTVFSLTEVSRVPTAILPVLQLGRRTVRGIQAAVFAEQHLGADGLIGMDNLAAQRLVIDFGANEMTISPSRRSERRGEGDAIVVTARSRLGRLILVDATLNGERIWVIIDTGADISIANEALRRRLVLRRRLGGTVRIEVTSVTGGTRMIDYGVARRLTIGGITISDLPLGFADVAPFRKLDLLDRPAILLGMDALQLFERVSLDFATREVRFDAPLRGIRVPRDAGYRWRGSGS